MKIVILLVFLLCLCEAKEKEGGFEMFNIKEESSAKMEHFGKIHPKLGLVFFDACFFLWKRGIHNVVITSVIRSKDKDTGIHSLGRAIDIRADFSDIIGLKLMHYINQKYIYDPERPEYKTIVFHKTDDADDEEYHYHLQVWVK